MVVALALLGAATLVSHAWRHAAPPPERLPTGRLLTPEGNSAEVGSFPTGILVSPDGKWLVVTTAGARQQLSVLRVGDGRRVSQLSFPAPQALYMGLAFAPRGSAQGAQAGSEGEFLLYVSRGPEDVISQYRLDAHGKLTPTGRALHDPSGLPKEAKGAQPNFLAGLALNSSGSRLYVAHNETSVWTGYQGSVGILDTATDRVLGKIPTPGFPYALAALTRGPHADRKLYVSSERDGVVSVIDVRDPAHPRRMKDIRTGAQPMALLLDSRQERLFVANAGSDTVSVLDTTTDRVLRTLSLALEGLPRLPGVTPTGLALSPDEKRLYVSAADQNAVLVVDPQGRTLGALPVGWYPTAVATTPDGHLMVANGKGVAARNPNKENAGPEGSRGKYIENLLEGTVALLTPPAATELARFTAQVVVNNRPLAYEPLPKIAIKHVFYVIKENRTYDQVLGDLPQGNGDPGLTLFGRNVTPNQHALAERFALLDGFYACAEVSADGWNWSTAGMTSAYGQRNVHFNYSRRGREYDFEGENNDSPVDLLGLPDVARPPAGYLWDLCLRKGVSFRNYGFFVSFTEAKDRNGRQTFPVNHPTKKALLKYTDLEFLRFEMDYADSDAWVKWNSPAPRQRRAYGRHQAPSRIAEWRREFDAYVRNGNLPQLVLLRLPRDHTQGTAPGLNTPRAMVADNDYAVGQLVEAVSHSPYWKESAIIVLEDDAQNGYDHVDAHRSICFVISPYVRRHAVDHRFYNTDSALRTIETLLGLPPMCQYDAAAPAISVFSAAPDNAEPYTALLPARELIGETNTALSYRAGESSRLDFRAADRVPDETLNDILWHSVRGAAPNPAPRRRIKVVARASEDQDDDPKSARRQPVDRSGRRR